MFYTLTIEQRDRRKKDKKANQVNCPQCPASLQGILKSKAFCIFCLNYVCKTHIVKKRKDPLIDDKIGKICKECEDAILFQKIMSKHQKKEQELKDQYQELQNTLDNVNSQFKDLLSQEQTIKYTIEKGQKEYEKKEQQAKQNIKEAEDRQDQCNQESLQLSQQYRKLVEEKQIKEKEKQALQEKHENIQQQEQQILIEIQEIQENIKTVNETISNITQEIARINYNQKSEEKEKQSLFARYTQSGVGTIQIDSKQVSEIIPRTTIQKNKKQILDQPDRGEGFCCMSIIPSNSKKKKG
ncbi:unnamed protein product [Paramecium pentaurelia]|uniref:Uncharacterized protein n=1 Tax=Paramecium pentaurelia TaxID=43138 RepID=A0A8S1VJJ9_9CILI|nr:unnamed protein product [Paramecium pentaurelia]